MEEVSESALNGNGHTSTTDTEENDEVQIKSMFPLPVPETILRDIIQKSKDFALMNGAAMRSKAKFNQDSLNFAPFVLFPSSFPRIQFEKSCEVQTVLNELMHKVAHDKEFLDSTLADTVRVDLFTRKLYEIYETCYEEGFTQPLSLGLLRSDVMLEGKKCEDEAKCKGQCYCFCRKQVEINTIASGFGHLGPVSRTIHKFIMKELGFGSEKMIKNLPENDALRLICQGIVKAWELYGREESCVLFLVEDVAYNICDQRFHEFYIREHYPHVKVLRKTLTEMHSQAKLGVNKELLVKSDEVSVVYFRAGYEPGHYHTHNEWKARLLIERSRAIKSPSIQYHLAGTKKVQQALAQPNALQRFLKDEEKIAAVQEIFTGLYGLENNEAGNAAFERALKDPEKFVLKPQREGGMNNVYGQEIAEVLQRMTLFERQAWILMDKINPPVTKGYIIRPGGLPIPPIIDLVAELGIFGVVIGDHDTIHVNYQAGHMLRSKISTANEGGVATGLGALDSPYLIDQC
ncbi:GSS family protein [Megaselia abdita]